MEELIHEKSNIKIFVSHCINQDNEMIDSPLYVNLRSGAVYDERENVTTLGDDTGDNISEKCDLYGDLTVLYWAWKNCDAQYYGFSRSTEYLVFNALKNDKKKINSFYLNDNFIKEYGLFEKKIYNIIEENDIAISFSDSINNEDGQFFYKYYKYIMLCNATDDVDIYLNIVKEKYPILFSFSKKMMTSNEFIFSSAFIMNKRYFNEYCEILFDILKEFEERIDTTYYSKYHKQQFYFWSIFFLNTYILYCRSRNINKIKQLPVATIGNAEKCEELFPAFSNNNIPIVLVCSNEYVPYLSVYLRSLLDYSSLGKNYDIIVFQKAITKENQEVLRTMCKSYKNVSIRFYNPQKRMQDVSFYVAQKEYCEEAYYRVFAPWHMTNYDKAIVMDCDILVQRDLGDLFELDLGDNYAAGVIDAVFQGMLNGWAVADTFQYAKDEMKMDNPYNYLNTGVLLIDFKKMRENFTETQLIKFCQDQNFRCQEQDVLNVILENHVKFLDLAWNCYVRSGDFVNYGLKWAPESVYREFLKAIEKPHLVHFVSYPKPWIDPRIEYGLQFWSTARRTPFYEIIWFNMVEGRYGGNIYDLQQRMGIFDTRTGARKLADRLFPLSSRRRNFVKALIPKGSLRWKFCKQVYYIFRPQYRPVKEKNSED